MPFEPSVPPWDVASPFGETRRLNDNAAVKALAAELKQDRISNLNTVLARSKSNRKDERPAVHCENWTWLHARSSMAWIQLDGSEEYVPILGGTADWFCRHIAPCRLDLISAFSEQNLRKLMRETVRSHGLETDGIGRGHLKWRLVAAPADPVHHVDLFVASFRSLDQRERVREPPGCGHAGSRHRPPYPSTPRHLSDPRVCLAGSASYAASHELHDQSAKPQHPSGVQPTSDIVILRPIVISGAHLCCAHHRWEGRPTRCSSCSGGRPGLRHCNTAGRDGFAWS